MSEIKVNKITPRTGTTITLGDSGDSLSIASGVTLTDFTSTGIDDNATSTALTIDSSENVLVGTTDNAPANNSTDSSADNGISLRGSIGKIEVARYNSYPIEANRTGVDGDIISFRKSGAIVGSIGAGGGRMYLGSADTGIYFDEGVDSIFGYNPSTQQTRDNAIDLGYSTIRYKNLYLGGNIYLGGTTSANALDDYETGTWTPTLSPLTSGSITLKTAVDKFSYTKIGDIVFLTGRIQVDSVSSPTGILAITGLPFTTADLDDQAGIVHFPIFTSGVDFNTAMSSMLEVTEGGTTGIVLQQRDNAAWITLGADKVSANDYFTINGSYRVS